MLVDYARDELERAGWFKTNDVEEGNPDGVYNGMVGSAVLEIVEVFAKQGHSGMSASVVTHLVEKLMRYEPLTPLTFGPEEWTAVGPNTLQNRRKFSVFSKDGGRTWYDVDEPGRPHHEVLANNQNKENSK